MAQGAQGRRRPGRRGQGEGPRWAAEKGPWQNSTISMSIVCCDGQVIRTELLFIILLAFLLNHTA